MRVGELYRKVIHFGVDAETPLPLVNRIIFSNFVCLLFSGVLFLFAVINLVEGYYLLLGMIGVYFLAVFGSFLLNLRRKYLCSRILLLGVVYLGIFLSCLIQGPQVELEHFFLPLGALAFALFYADERKISFLFLFFAMAAYFFLVTRSAPVWKIDPAAGRYTASDLLANRFGYIALFAICLYALSAAHEHALKVIDEQRTRLFEERRLAAFGSMVGIMAHEINSPLTALDLHLYQVDQALKKGNASLPELTNRIDRIRSISRRLSVIVKGLKFLSRQDHGDAVGRHRLSQVVSVAVDLVHDRIEHEGVKLEQDWASADEELSCRPVALSQVVLNLLNNAIDAVENLPPEKRWVRIGARREGWKLVLSVEDGGYISSDEARKNLFRNFFTTKPAGKGTGLGLSISRDTVLAHGGELRYESKCPHTKFVIELPRLEET